VSDSGAGPRGTRSPEIDLPLGPGPGYVRLSLDTVCKSRKPNDLENLAEVDFSTSVPLQSFGGRWSFLCQTTWSLTSPRAKRISGPKKFRSLLVGEIPLDLGPDRMLSDQKRNRTPVHLRLRAPINVASECCESRPWRGEDLCMLPTCKEVRALTLMKQPGRSGGTGDT
jgi:hypothetical protein